MSEKTRSKKLKGVTSAELAKSMVKHLPRVPARRTVERRLRDLYEVGYLDHAPDKADGHFRTKRGYDKGSLDAVTQFLEMHKDLENKFTPTAREKARGPVARPLREDSCSQLRTQGEVRFWPRPRNAVSPAGHRG